MYHSKKIKGLLDQIERTRQHLDHLNRIHDGERSTNTLVALNALYSELFQATKQNEAARTKALKPKQMRLVFSEMHPDGMMMSSEAYIALYKTMSAMDRQTHIAVDVDDQHLENVDNIISLDSARTRRRA